MLAQQFFALPLAISSSFPFRYAALGLHSELSGLPPLSKLTAIRIQMVQGDDTATTHHFLSLKRKATVLTTVVNAPLSSLVISCSLRELARGETLCCAPCCPTYFTAYYTAARFIITRRSAEKPGLGMLFWDKAFLKPSAIKQWVRGGAGLGPGLK
jgi:hypothetical protein